MVVVVVVCTRPKGGAWCENRPEGALPGAQRSGGGTMGGGGCRGGPSPPAVASARSGGVALSCPVGSVAAPPALPGCLPAVWLWQSGDDVPQWASRGSTAD